MKIATYIPCDPLKPFIKAYRIVESQGELVNRILPDTSFAMAFRCRGQISYIHEINQSSLPISTFSGLRKSVRLINYAPNTVALIVQFKETGLPAFFKQPLHELFEKSISLDNFFLPSEILMLEELLAGTEGHSDKITIIEQFLRSKLLYRTSDTLITEAITKIQLSQGIIRIRELADDLYISQDAFEKRFRKAIGGTPKQFAFIVKMKAIIRKTPVPPSFLDMALDNGYHDHSHFNKDFKLFTGLTPTDFFKSATYW